MKKYLIILLISFATFSQTTLQKNWSTYFLGNSSNVTDSKVDHLGNLIICGFINLQPTSINYFTQFTTAGCYQSTPNGGIAEGFIVKFSPSGNLLWATYFGGEDIDSCGRIVIDENNNIYVTGRTQSTTHIATPNTYISNVSGLLNTTGFLAKFTSTGNLLWSTYIPGIVLDVKLVNNEVCFAGYTSNPDSLTTLGSYRETMETVTNYGFFMKFNTQGYRLYGTYLEKGIVSNFDVDNNGNYIFVGNASSSFITTPGCHQPTFAGGIYNDCYLMKFDSNITNKAWATFFGGDNSENIYRLLIYNNDFYIVGTTRSSNNIATSNSMQPTNSNVSSDEGFIAKFNLDGVIQWGTYYGGVNSDYVYDLKIHNDKLYVAGTTASATNIATSGSFQDTYVPTYYDVYLISGGFFAEFNLDGTRNWASYYNGADVRHILFSDFDGFYLLGRSASTTGISTDGTWQPSLSIGPATFLPYNGFISKFEFVPLSTTSFSDANFTISPNPVKDILNINTKENIEVSSISVYNTLGQLVLVNSNQNKVIDVSSLTTGNYFIKIVSSEGISNGKFIKE
jgi:Secretion system C-terminal sorting domain/Beta-propeller repeat